MSTVLLLQSSPKVHHEVRLKYFNHFDFNTFSADNYLNFFANVLGISDPDSALHLWLQIFFVYL